MYMYIYNIHIAFSTFSMVFPISFHGFLVVFHNATAPRSSFSGGASMRRWANKGAAAPRKPWAESTWTIEMAISLVWNQWEISRILKWRYVSTIFLVIFCGYIPLHSPEKQALYMVGTSNLGSWNGHWWNIVTGWWLTNIAIENGPVEIVDFPIFIAWWFSIVV